MLLVIIVVLTVVACRSLPHGTFDLVSPPGIAMPPAGSCFTSVTLFFNVGPFIRQRVDGSQRGLLRQHSQSMKSITTATNLLNFGPVTHEILSRSFAWVVSSRRLKHAMCWFLKTIR